MSEESLRHPSNNPTALPAGTRLGEFELLSLLGIGGFGIVYLAFDHALEREVAIKEYMPAALAGRTATMHVSIRSQSDAESFALGLRSFVNEARLLARFDHPSLLKVHRFWEGNGTAYMAMPVMRGRTVKDVRMDMPFAPDEAWLRALLDPLLGAIEKLHSEGVYHRDIAPDNIQIEPDGHPVLLDFGAARRVLTDKSQALTAILKPAYAPIEQYGEAGSVKQGPWTDIYALGATLHFLLLMRPPAPATARTIHDEASALTTMALPGCSENFLRIIDWMLAPRPVDRPQSVAALREVLEGRAPTPMRRAAAQEAASDWDRTVIVPVSGPTVAARTSLPPAPPPGPVAPVWPPQDDYDADATVILPTPTRHNSTTRAMPPQGLAPVASPLAPAIEPAAHEPVQTTVRVPPPPPPAPPAPVAREPEPAPQPTKAKPPASSPASASVAKAKGNSKALPIGLGLGALVIVAAAVFGLTRKSEVPPKAQDTTAATVSAPAPVAAPSQAPPTTVPESKVATVVVPAAPQNTTVAVAPAPTGPASAGAIAATGKSAQASAAAASKIAANKSAAAARAASAQQAAPAPVVVAAPQYAPAPEAPKPAPTPVQEAPKPVATNPEARCAGRSSLSYFVCMEKECLKSEQQGSADCKKWRQNARTE